MTIELGAIIGAVVAIATFLGWFAKTYATVAYVKQELKNHRVEGEGKLTLLQSSVAKLEHTAEAQVLEIQKLNEKIVELLLEIRTRPRGDKH